MLESPGLLRWAQRGRSDPGHRAPRPPCTSTGTASGFPPPLESPAPPAPSQTHHGKQVLHSSWSGCQSTLPQWCVGGTGRGEFFTPLVGTAGAHSTARCQPNRTSQEAKKPNKLTCSRRAFGSAFIVEFAEDLTFLVLLF